MQVCTRTLRCFPSYHSAPKGLIPLDALGVVVAVLGARRPRGASGAAGVADATALAPYFRNVSHPLFPRYWRSVGVLLTLGNGAAARRGRGGSGLSRGGGRGGGRGHGLAGGRRLGHGAAARAGVGAAAAGEDLGAGDDVVGDRGVVDADLHSGVGALLTWC